MRSPPPPRKRAASAEVPPLAPAAREPWRERELAFELSIQLSERSARLQPQYFRPARAARRRQVCPARVLLSHYLRTSRFGQGACCVLGRAQQPRLIPFASLTNRGATFVSCLPQVMMVEAMTLCMARRTSLPTRRLSTCEEVRFAICREASARPCNPPAHANTSALSLCRRSVRGRDIIGRDIVVRGTADQTAPASPGVRASLGCRVRRRRRGKAAAAATLILHRGSLSSSCVR